MCYSGHRRLLGVSGARHHRGLHLPLSVCTGSSLPISLSLCSCLTAFSALTLLVGWQEQHPACKKTEWWGAGVVICLERGAELHVAQLMPLPLTVSWFSKIQIRFTFLIPAHLGSPGKRAVKRVSVCSCLPAGTAGIVCMYCCLCNCRASVCLSHPANACCFSRFAAVSPVGRRYRLIAAWPAGHQSAAAVPQQQHAAATRGQCHVVS